MASAGATGVDTGEVSGICKDLDEAVEALRNRPLDVDCLYLWLGGLYVKSPAERLHRQYDRGAGDRGPRRVVT